MKRIYKSSIKSFAAVAVLTLGVVLPSCVSDDLLLGPGAQSVTEPWQDKNLVPIPLGISYEAVSTRATADTVYGSAKEHEIDFDTSDECYAIFFTTISGVKKVKYITPLYYNKQLSDKYQPGENNLAEYTVFAVAYVPKDDVPLDLSDYENDEKKWEDAQKKDKLSDVLVVLNGGKIYKKFHDLIYTENADGKEVIDTSVTLEDILDTTWDDPMILTHGSVIPGEGHEGWQEEIQNQVKSDGTIGINAKGLYTMTNSAYWDNVKDEYGNPIENQYEPMTLTPLSGPYFVSIEDYLDSKNEENNQEPQPNALVKVERMVAKFSEPVLSTEVYGSDRFFRPSDNVPHLVVFDWDGEDSRSREIDWRIHLRGWTINGNETKSFLFKKIPDKVNLTGWNFNNWNDAGLKRSYWSNDPHYSLTLDDNGNSIDFYPWQARKAADLKATRSLEAGLAEGLSPALRYHTFNEVTWAEGGVRYFSENTFDPEGNWELDNRNELLAGPHLLLTGEIYLKNDAVDYTGTYLNFDPVPHLYGDRIQRYYLTELDFFKMFLSEFNESVRTNWQMTFPLLDWEDPSDKINSKYQARPAGNFSLYFRGPVDMFEELRNGNDKEQEMYKKIMDAPYYNMPEGETYEGDPEGLRFYFYKITFDLLDALQYMWENGKTMPYFINRANNLFSTNAQIYEGDGRIIPWLEHLHIRKPQEGWTPGVNQTEVDHPLDHVNFVNIEGDEYDPNGEHRNNFYKSFIREWWGPVDHFNGGRLYYAGSIRHQKTSNEKFSYFGTVRNHWYKFTITAINGIGTPIDDPNQLIIPDKYAYKDQITSHMEIVGWHLKDTLIDFDNY